MARARTPPVRKVVSEIEENGGRAGYVIGSPDDPAIPAKLIAHVIEQNGDGSTAW